MPSTVEQVRNELTAFFGEHGIQKSDRIALAFSGGSDSLALLLALHCSVEPGSLFVFYVNHHLRSKEVIEQEIELNRTNCERLSLELHVLDLGEHTVQNAAKNRGTGIEESARTLRYQALTEACQRYSCSFLATAHNADDQVETLLMRVFQSSSLDALGGISAYQIREDGLILIRPLLGLRHTVLRESVAMQGYSWSDDASNDEDYYLRNRIRHNLKPALLTVFPQAYQASKTMSKRFSDIGNLLQSLVDNAMKEVTVGQSYFEFSLLWFQSLESIVQESLLFRLYLQIRGSVLERVRNAQIQQLLCKLGSSSISDRWVLESSNTRMVLLDGGMVRWEAIAPIWHFCLPLREPGRIQNIYLANDVVFTIDREDPSFDSSLLRLDAEQLEDPVIRSVAAQDEIALSGGTVLVTKLFSQYKIPRYLHPSIPLLCDKGGVVAVFARFLGGHDRLACRFKAPLARRLTNIYSSNKRNDYSEIEKR